MGRGSVRELVVAMQPRYRQGDRRARGRMLDEFCAATGYHRVYARSLLRGTKALRRSATPPRRGGRPPRYGAPERLLLELCWELCEYVCSKRLGPFLETLIAKLARLQLLPPELTPAVQARVAGMSAATIDRLLHDARDRWPRRGRGTTKPGSLLRDQIPIRTYAEWDEVRPGFLELDLVAHCGNNASGEFAFTLSGVDVATGWISLEAVRNKGELAVFKAFEQLRARLPFPLLGIDCDNGGEFINHNMQRYCEREQITLTRSRPYRKNNNCFIQREKGEQKNWSVVRRLVGYARFEGSGVAMLQALYDLARDHVNYLQPVRRLVDKTRDGTRVTRHYDRAQTPFQRVQADPTVADTVKQHLAESEDEINPVTLTLALKEAQKDLYHHAVGEGGVLRQ